MQLSNLLLVVQASVPRRLVWFSFPPPDIALGLSKDTAVVCKLCLDGVLISMLAAVLPLSSSLQASQCYFSRNSIASGTHAFLDNLILERLACQI